MLEERSLSRSRGLVRPLAAATLFAAGIGVAARVTIPMWPVPITLQVLLVLLAGMVLGSRWGGLSVLEYIAAGLAGVPVFSGGGAGIAFFLVGTGSRTGGYIVGFAVAAFLAGLIVERGGDRLPVYLAAALAGIAAIYLFGWAWLALWFALAGGKLAGAAVASGWTFGVTPFLLVDAVKGMVAAGVARSGRSLVRPLLG